MFCPVASYRYFWILCYTVELLPRVILLSLIRMFDHILCYKN